MLPSQMQDAVHCSSRSRQAWTAALSGSSLLVSSSAASVWPLKSLANSARLQDMPTI